MAKTQVFISWSGDASKAVAEGLARWLPTVVQAVDPFVSTNIDAGSVWFEEIVNRLRDGAFAILCVTPDNIGSP